MSPLIKKIHRLGGLTITVFIIFYCITGAILNHRKDFDYFIRKRAASQDIEKYDTYQVRALIDFYKKQIGREDDPKVIRIKKNGEIEFLYGSHGSTTYVVTPEKGKLKKIVKKPVEPLGMFNNLHKAFKTSTHWAFLSDTLTLVIMVVIATGLMLFSFTINDWLILVGGGLILILGMVLN
jgi:hypothetical protein